MAERLARTTQEHLFLVTVSLLAAIAVALPLGIVSYRRPRLGNVILGVVGVIQTLPSMALLVLMIPFFGLGAWPAIVTMFLYSLLPIVRNTATGLRRFPPASTNRPWPWVCLPWPGCGAWNCRWARGRSFPASRRPP